MNRLLTYGLFENKLKHISEVNNGIACGCFCPNCKHPLVAKNNIHNKKLAHFAHSNGKECGNAIESALHLLAKEVLQKTKMLKIPAFHYDYNPENIRSKFRPSQDLEFDQIRLEQVVEIEKECIIPDAIGEKNGNLLFIEFANTHFTDENKKNKLKKAKIACIEIDLKGQNLDENELISFFNSESNFIYWLNNPKLEKEYFDFNIKQRNQTVIEWKKKEKERLDKIKKEKLENEAKAIKYQNSKSFKVFLKDKWEKVSKCPLKKSKLLELKSTRFYKHKTLKKIIDGEFWNGKIYGFMSNGKYIFFNGEKVIIYPPDSIKTSNIDDSENKLFYAGLHKIIPILKDPFLGYCKSCQFLIDSYYIDKNKYYVCGHK